MQAEENSSQSMQLATYLAYANLSAVRLLAKLLVEQGALKEGSFAAELRREIEAEPSLQKRPDFQMLTLLLHQLENDPPDGRLN